MKEKEIEISEKINGEVRISLSDYTKLISSHVLADNKRRVFEDAIQAVSSFLNFIKKEDSDHFSVFVEKFNAQSEKLKIYIDEYGYPRMGIKNE